MIEWVLKLFGLIDIAMWFVTSLSVDSDPKKGASATKLTAFTLVVCFIHLIYKYSEKGEFTHFETVLIIIAASAAFFLSLYRISDVLKFYAILKGQKLDVADKKPEDKPNEPA